MRSKSDQRSLWRAAYPEYYFRHDNYAQQHLEGWKEHIDHCADILRQKLMCDADSTLMTFNWLKGHELPHPNFNVQHTCRNYSRLVEMTRSYRIDVQNLPSREDYVDKPLVDFNEPPFDPAADS